jgi:hypothetical protein
MNHRLPSTSRLTACFSGLPYTPISLYRTKCTCLIKYLHESIIGRNISLYYMLIRFLEIFSTYSLLRKEETGLRYLNFVSHACVWSFTVQLLCRSAHGCLRNLVWTICNYCQNYWVFGLSPSSRILKIRKRHVLKTDSVPVLWWGGRHLLCLFP